MKKFLSILLVLVLALSLVACGEKKEEPQQQGQEQSPQQQPQEQQPVTPPAPSYEGLELSFKNKTGVTITGLYLYEAGSADKGHSLCLAQWPDKDANGDLYEFNAFVYRKPGATYDLYVEFEDGTNATWAGRTLANYDKLSLKGGVDPAKWEQEPVDDAADKALMDEVKAKGYTADGFYPNYKTIGLELKNKTDKEIKAMYFFEEGGTAENYPNIVEKNCEGNWVPGKGGQYLFGYFVRPITKTYALKVVFDDDTDLTVEDLDFDTPNGDGFIINEISLKDSADPDLEKIEYDDGVPEPIDYINDAIVSGEPLDGYMPKVEL